MTIHECIFFNKKNAVSLVIISLTLLGYIITSVYAYSIQKSRISNLEESNLQIIKILEKYETDKDKIKESVNDVKTSITTLTATLNAIFNINIQSKNKSNSGVAYEQNK